MTSGKASRAAWFGGETAGAAGSRRGRGARTPPCAMLRLLLCLVACCSGVGNAVRECSGLEGSAGCQPMDDDEESDCYQHEPPVPQMTEIEHMHVEIGDNITVACNASVLQGCVVDLLLDIPGNNSFQMGRGVCPFNTLRYFDEYGMPSKKGILACTLTNVTHANEGNYVCHVSLNGAEKNITKYLRVYDRGATYLELSSDYVNLKTHPISISSQRVENFYFTIYIKSNPEVKSIKWFKGKDKKILDSSLLRIKIENYETSTSISIDNLTVHDSGSYTVEANNGFNYDSITFSLNISGLPNVTVHKKQWYLYKVKHNISCTVVGNPLSKIKWFEHFCELPQYCDYKEITVDDEDSYRITDSTDNKFTQTSTLTITALEIGQVICSATNEEGERNATADIIIADMSCENSICLIVDNMSRDPKDQPVQQDEVTLTCSAPTVGCTSDVKWYKGNATVANTTGQMVRNTASRFTYRTSLMFPNISKKHAGEYECRWKTTEGHMQFSSFHLQVKDIRNLVLTGRNTGQTVWNVAQGKAVNMTCFIEGSPKPNMTWYKGEKLLKKGTYDEKRIILSNFTLTIIAVIESDEGEYRCEGRNKFDVCKRRFTVTLSDKKNSTGLIVGIVILALILIAAIAILVYKIREARRIKRDMVATGLHHFVDGAMENFNPDLPIDEQADLLPYDKRWELPRNRLKMGRQLGAGAFGVVRKAEAWGIVEGENVTTVAVKMVKSADYAYIKALASELKIMLHLGKHLNVVNLLGACTEDLNKKEFLIIVEYCRYGNLQNFLMRHRALFIDQLDPETGKIDFSKGEELLNTSKDSKSRFRSLKLSRGDSSQSMRRPSGDAEACGSVPTSPTDNSDMSVCMLPGGSEEYPIMSNNSVQPGWRSNFHGDYRSKHMEPVFTRDLLCWAFQVARGMEYLASRKVMHGDLAARNILLADDNVVKICDFGLAKSMYKSDNYKKKGEGPLPVKWMAIEAIRDRIFSTQSDVWSFGVVLWEIFSLSRTPYPGMEADEKLFNNLISGYRMECPQYATREIYQLMLDCWEVKPTRRPSFSKLVEQLGAMLQENIRAHYIDLNDPYVAMNEQFSQDQTDYLNMITAPTYENMMSPSYEKPEHHYVNNPEAAQQMFLDAAEGSGYIKMKKSSRLDDMMIFSPREAGEPKSNIFAFSPLSTQKKLTNQSLEAGGEVSSPMSNDDDLGVQKTSTAETTHVDSQKNIEPMKEIKTTKNLELPDASMTQTIGFSNPNYVGLATGAQQNSGVESSHEQQTPVGDYMFMGRSSKKK